MIDEYKILQDKIDKIGGFRFTIKGWSVTAVIAANIAADVLFTAGISSIVDSADGADNKYLKNTYVDAMGHFAYAKRVYAVGLSLSPPDAALGAALNEGFQVWIRKREPLCITSWLPPLKMLEIILRH